MAERWHVDGKSLITGLAIAHEVASRIGISLGSIRGKTGGYPARSYGFGGCTIGAAVGVAHILGFDSKSTANAMGLAGAFAPLPGHTKWLYTPHNGMAKYGPSGWTAQAGVMAALLTERGYSGDCQILDGEYGFWAMNGSESCDFDCMVNKLGEDWMVLKTAYKRYPCCGLFTSSLDALYKILLENDIKPYEIEEILLKSEAYGSLPRFQNCEMDSHIDAQFMLPYIAAVAAHGVPIGPEWQSDENVHDKVILALMKKVRYEAYPRCEEARHQDLVIEKRPYIRRRPACAEVAARGKRFVQKVEYAQWASMEKADMRASDEDLAGKFRANAVQVLPSDRIELAVQTIMRLEDLSDAGELMAILVP